MTIIKVKNSTEKYQVIARFHTQRNQLTGRGYDIESTKTRILHIKNNLEALGRHFSVMVDVGCGDGSFLEQIGVISHKKIGILPTKEEVDTVEKIVNKDKGIIIARGLSTDLPFDEKSIDLILCNSVLHGVGFTRNDMVKSIDEFFRVQEENGILYIGEIPEADATLGVYNAPQIKRSAISYIKHAIKYLMRFISSEIHIDAPGKTNCCIQTEFIEILNNHGYKVLCVFNSETNDVVVDKIPDVHRRLDYLCQKSKL